MDAAIARCMPNAANSSSFLSYQLVGSRNAAAAYLPPTSCGLFSLRICSRTILSSRFVMSASVNDAAVADAEGVVGQKEVKLWGGRFKESMTPAVERFSQSVSFDKKLYKDDLAGSRAHASMLSKQGLISEDDLEAILKGIDEIETRIEAGKFLWRSDREDVHMNIEAALIDLVGDPAKKLHTARSRNDQVVTDVRLWCRRHIDQIIESIIDLQVVLVNLATDNKGLVVPGYTHLQRAQPLLLQHLLLAYVEQLERDASRLNDCRARLNHCPLGSCTLAGTGLPIDRFATAQALGFTGPLRNSVDAVSDRDFLIELLSANSIIAIHLSRLAEEWVLWASEEFGFLIPNDAVSSGSSIMPQKKNPDPMELVRGKSARVIGDLTSILVLCKGLPQAYNRDLQGVPFRTSHDIVGKAVALAVSKRTELSTLSLQELKNISDIFDDDVYSFLGTINAIVKFQSYGSTGEAQVASQMQYWKEKLRI